MNGEGGVQINWQVDITKQYILQATQDLTGYHRENVLYNQMSHERKERYMQELQQEEYHTRKTTKRVETLGERAVLI